MAKSKLPAHFDNRRIEPNRCHHGKIKVWKNKHRGCKECAKETQAIIKSLDLGGDIAAQQDDRNDLLRHRTALFHLGKEPV